MTETAETSHLTHSGSLISPLRYSMIWTVKMPLLSDAATSSTDKRNVSMTWPANEHAIE